MPTAAARMGTTIGPDMVGDRAIQPTAVACVCSDVWGSQRWAPLRKSTTNGGPTADRAHRSPCFKHCRALQKHVCGADCTATVADRRRTCNDRKMQSAIDRRHGHVYVVDMSAVPTARRSIGGFLRVLQKKKKNTPTAAMWSICKICRCSAVR